MLPNPGLAAQFLDDERLEQLPEQGTVIAKVCRFDAERRPCQARVGQMELRVLDEALHPIGVPGRKLFHEEDMAQQRQVAAHGRAIDTEWPGNPAHVDQSRRLLGREFQHTRQEVKPLDAGEIADIALDDRVQAIANPGPPAPLGVAPHDFGESPSHDEFRQFRAKAFALGDLELAGGDPLQEPRLMTPDLHFAEGMEADEFHAAGKGIGDPWDEERVRRARKQEASGPTITIDRLLDGEEELGDPLDFIDGDGTFEIEHEPGGIRLDHGERRGIVQGEVLAIPVLAEAPGKRSLVALPRPVQQHNGGIGESFAQARPDEARVEFGCRRAAGYQPTLVQLQELIRPNARLLTSYCRIYFQAVVYVNSCLLPPQTYGFRDRSRHSCQATPAFTYECDTQNCAPSLG